MGEVGASRLRTQFMDDPAMVLTSSGRCRQGIRNRSAAGRPLLPLPIV